MSFEEHRHVVEDDPVVGGTRSVASDRLVRTRLSGAELASRLVILLFGLIQLVIALRILLLAIAAERGNPIVSAVLDLSRPLVDPFQGIVGTDALRQGAATFDVTALVALIGWTILEVVLVAFVRLFRRGPVV